jgi:hypothetical protein
MIAFKSCVISAKSDISKIVALVNIKHLYPIKCGKLEIALVFALW